MNQRRVVAGKICNNFSLGDLIKSFVLCLCAKPFQLFKLYLARMLNSNALCIYLFSAAKNQSAWMNGFRYNLMQVCKDCV